METNKELYEKRFEETMKKFLKNIKECDQDPNKKKLWEPFTKDDDICDFFKSH